MKSIIDSLIFWISAPVLLTITLFKVVEFYKKHNQIPDVKDVRIFMNGILYHCFLFTMFLMSIFYFVI